MLVTCDRCKRHYSIRETGCPFCSHASALSRFGAAALSAGVLLSGCDAGNKVKNPQGSSTPIETKRTYATLAGKLTSPQGDPLAGAMISVTATNQTTNQSVTKIGRTDEHGHYFFDLLEPETYSLNIEYNGNGAAGAVQKPVVLKAGEDQTVDVALDLRRVQPVAPPYGAPPMRRRLV